jgi:hypothetical protein
MRGRDLTAWKKLMEQNPFGPTGPQLYVISEHHFIELRNHQVMLDEFAHEVFNDSHRGDQRLLISRAELNYLFAGISALIGRVLDGVGEQNGVVPPDQVWQ